MATPKTTRRVLIRQYGKGQNQGLVSDIAIVECPYEEKRMYLRRGNGCCTPALNEEVVGLIYFGGERFVVRTTTDFDKPNERYEADFEISLHGDFTLPKDFKDSEKNRCPHCKRPLLRA